LLEQFLRARAVHGTSNYFQALDLTVEDDCALQEIVRKGWATASETSDYSFQLTSTLLNMMPVQFGLQTPFKVFQRRPDIALTDATMFELVLEVQRLGFKHTVRKGRKHETSAYFAKGFLPVVQFVLFGLFFGH